MVYISIYVNALWPHIFSFECACALNNINSNRTGCEASNDDLNDDMESTRVRERKHLSERTATEIVCKDWETRDNLSALPPSARIRYF
jgi:hypothetical protein